MSVLIPFIIVISLFALLAAVLYNGFHTDLISVITTMIQKPLCGVMTGLFDCVLLNIPFVKLNDAVLSKSAAGEEE